MKHKEERRKQVICPNCGQEMICMNNFEAVYDLIRGYYVWYVCPRRKKEGGCGHRSMFEVSPKTKRPEDLLINFDEKKEQCLGEGA